MADEAEVTSYLRSGEWDRIPKNHGDSRGSDSAKGLHFVWDTRHNFYLQV